MKKFIVLYLVNILLLFILFYWDIFPISDFIHSLQTNFTIYLLKFTLPTNILEENKIIITSHYYLVVEKECNGVIPYLFFVASIFAFPSTIAHKIKWVLFGYVGITTINIFRIYLITKLVLQGRDNFSLAHDYIGNYLLILVSLLLFILFIKNR